MEVLNFRKIDKGCLFGKFDLSIAEWGGLTIHDCTLFIKENRRWISLPGREYQSLDGKKKYFNLIKFNPEVFKRLEDSAVAMLNQLINVPIHDQNFTENIPF